MAPPVPLITVALRREPDILLARQRSRHISLFLGFSNGDATRITTALSEVARNAFEYAGGGTVAFSVESHGTDRQDLVIRVADKGPGIPELAVILSADYKSQTGMGIGIRGSRALMDHFEIVSPAGEGTTVTMAKALRRSTSKFGPPDAARLIDELAKASEATPLGELQMQNQALIRTLEQLTEQQAEVKRLDMIATDARDRAEAARVVAARSVVVRERFMALTTHELRTPLNAIMGYLDLLDMELAASITEKQKVYFARINRACKHLVGITNDFLDMASGDVGGLKVARHEGTARHVMSEASALVAPQAAARGITVELSETSERVVYLGDVDRVRQVLVNVLGNAVSFTPVGGRVAVVAARVCEAPAASGLVGGPWCSIRVEDSGPGIPGDKLDHVFEPFVQLSSDGQATRKGTGLGLTVSRQLAVLMGGDLTVESSGAGVGATFTLWLPESISNGTRGLAPGRRSGELTPSGHARVVAAAPAAPAAH
ncbi:MAG TPA: sensor histidine kinase [Gemmatimonadaceae bacterium]